MQRCKILFSNLGYARGISGDLTEHITRAHRHFYCPPDIQKAILQQLSALIAEEDPDICCFVEIDQGSFTSGRLNQLAALLNEHYAFFDIENKYGPTSRLRSFFLTAGKSNAFIAKQPMPYEKIYFRAGTKRLIYKVALNSSATLFFAHFSLNRAVRARQILEIRQLVADTPGEVIVLGDFNVLTGLGELAPLMEDSGLTLLNKPDSPTFRFHRKHLLLDLCLCSEGLADKAELKIVPQPFSDHAALMLDIPVSPPRA